MSRAASDKPRPRRPSRLLALLTLLVVLSAIALWVVPVVQVRPWREVLSNTSDLAPAERISLDNQLLEAENGARSTLAVILGAAGVLLAAGIIWRRFEVSRELKAHERFTQAVEHLGAERSNGTPRTEVRLSGIYTLERLAAESELEYWPVMEVLTAYLRDNAAWSRADAQKLPRPSADVQAVLGILGRRHPPQTGAGEKPLLDLRETDLRGANLSGSRLDGVSLFAAHLERVDATRAVLSRSNLREASLAGATLTGADLEGASLSRANLEGARLNDVNLQGADLSGANLRGADLWEANLKGCNLKDADLRGADLSQCVLEEAILWRADLQNAVLTGAHLRETHLERANLLGVSGLTWEQGEDAYTDENTLLPEYLAPSRVPALQQQADNVVALNAPVPRTRKTEAPADPAPPAPAKPKKAALPKRRKQDLVKPA